MKDKYERVIDYLRISITDRCNLRCKYCMPEGAILTTMDRLLTLEEICEAVRAGTELGISHIKLTGGEPLLRRGLVDLVGMLKKIQGVKTVTLTTNGILLEEKLPALLEAGLDGVNISLDCLDRETYKAITGYDGLDLVLGAIEASCRAGLKAKVNAVSLDLGERNIRDLVLLAKDLPVDVRFIEMMPIGYGKNYPVISHEKLMAFLRREFPLIQEDPSSHGYGPAIYYQIPGFIGSIGRISAIHGKFCESCNRVRLTSEGYLKTCLCFHQGADLREILRSGKEEARRKEKLLEAMRLAIYEKPRAHCFEEPEEMTEGALMNAIGG